LPGPAAALVDLLDDLVAVARLLGEQDEDRRADVPLARLGGAAPGASLPARPRGTRPRAGAEQRAEGAASAEHPAEVGEVAESAGAAVHVPVFHVLHHLLRSL